MEIKKEYVSFKELYSSDFELTDLFGMRQRWTKGVVFNMRNRPSCGIILLHTCNGEYYNEKGDSFYASENSLVVLPYGSNYSVLNADCSSSRVDAYLVEFNIKNANSIYTFGDFPFLLNLKNNYKSNELLKRIVDCFESPQFSPLLLKALFYELLAEIAKEEYFSDVNSNYNVIINGINLMKSDITGVMSIAEIAKSCHISEGHFRRLFSEYIGKSPKQFQASMQIRTAKNLLINTTSTIEYISDVLSFSNVGYFCRFFKKKTGMTPTEFRQKFKK